MKLLTVNIYKPRCFEVVIVNIMNNWPWGCLHDTGATFAPERVHCGSLSWLYICLHDTTKNCYAGASHPGVSLPRFSHRGENFTPVRNLATVSCKLETTTHFGHSRPQSHDPSDLRQRSSALAVTDFLSMCRVIVSYSQPIRFARFVGKSVNRRLPVLDKSRALDFCRRSEGSLLWGRECHFGVKSVCR